jgi:hypothetical protein
MIMREAPLGENRTAARDDAGDALCGQRHVVQPYAGMDREIVNALFSLLDERVAVQFPRQLLGLTIDFLERLIDWHSADRHRRIAQNPLARLVNVLAGRKVHYRVGAPARRPRHLVDFLFDRRCDRRVSDVRVDLDVEAAADDHRLAFGVVDIRRNDRAPARYFVTHERRLDSLANRDELHLRRDLAAAGVVHLGNVRAGFAAANRARIFKSKERR